MLVASDAAMDLYFNNFGVVLKISLSARKVLGSIPLPVKSDTVSLTVRHRCNVSSELCSPGAKPRRLAQLLVTRFGVKPRV